MDKLLSSHPNRSLNSWVDYARAWGGDDSERAYYEANSKRLLTTWGGDPVNDYSGRVWSGLIRDYYIPRWLHYHNDGDADKKLNLRKWEEEWINTKGVTSVKLFENPLQAAKKLYHKYNNSK